MLPTPAFFAHRMKLLPRIRRAMGPRNLCANVFAAALIATLLCSAGQAARAADLPDYEQQIKPIVIQYCYDCHANGEKNGNVAFDEMKTPEQLLGSPEIWSKALRHVRSG